MKITLKTALVSMLLAMVLNISCQAQTKLIDSVKLKAIELFMEYQTAKGFSGCVLVSERQHILFNKGYGLARLNPKIRNQENTVFEIASVTKLFTVVAILQLAEKGKLTLDDHLSKYLGSFDPPKDKATIRHLVLHTAGLVPRGYALDYYSRNGFINSVKSAPAESIPGEQYRYTNAGYIMLAAIIEKVSGVDFPVYLKENIFDVLGLTQTFFGRDESANNSASGYSGNTPDSLKIYHTPPAVWGDRGPSGIVTNTLELHQFLIGLQNESLLSKSSISLMQEEQMEGEAFGFHVYQKPITGKLLARGGGLPHFESQVAWYLDHDVKIILLINNRLKFRKPVWDGLEALIFQTNK